VRVMNVTAVPSKNRNKGTPATCNWRRADGSSVGRADPDDTVHRDARVVIHESAGVPGWKVTNSPGWPQQRLARVPRRYLPPPALGLSRDFFVRLGCLGPGTLVVPGVTGSA